MARARRQEEFEPIADEVYKVEREGPGAFLVRHFPDPVTRRSCCSVRVKVSERDRSPDRSRDLQEADPLGECEALRRAYLAIEKKHGRIVDNKSKP